MKPSSQDRRLLDEEIQREKTGSSRTFLSFSSYMHRHSATLSFHLDIKTFSFSRFLF